MEDIRWGLKWGVGLSLVMTIYTIGLYLALGSEPFGRVGVAPHVAGILYIVSSLAAGFVVGLLRPLATTRDGAMLVGTIAALPGSIAMHANFFGPLASWSTGDWIQCAFIAALFGAGLGYMWHGRSWG